MQLVAQKRPYGVHQVILALAALLAVTLALALGSSSVLAHAGAPSGAGVQPVFTDDNPTCGTLTDDPNVIELKVEPVAHDDFSDGTLTVHIDPYNTVDGPAFDWTSNIPLGTIFVKGGPDGNLYTYSPQLTADTLLHAPENHNNDDQWYGLSHISFCYSPDAFITIEESGTNFIYDPHELTATVETIGGDIATSGADTPLCVTFTLTNSNGATADFTGPDDGNDCDGDGDNLNDCTIAGGVGIDTGDCSVHIVSPTPGDTEIEACADVPIDTDGDGATDLTLTRCTDGSASNPPAEKEWIAGSVTLDKTFEEGPFTSPGEACFTLSRILAPPPPVSSDPATQCGTGVALSFTWDDLVAGLHCIEETTVPTGYVKMVDICFTVDENNLDFSFDRNNPLGLGDLRILKLLGPGGTTWTGPNVTFHVCPHDPAGDPTELSPAVCVGAPAPQFDVTFPSGQSTPVVVDSLDEGYYTVCEDVPAGFTVDDQCQVAQVVAGQEGTASDLLTFTNTPPLFEGCTPGFWRNHTSLWDQFSDPVVQGMPAGLQFVTTTGFNAYFGLTPAQSGFSNSLTMLDGVKKGGGGGSKLARHGVAALLNEAAGLNYQLPPGINNFTELRTAIRNAYLTSTFEPLAEQLKDANEAGCPLN